ncbi:hypothetical protein QTP88_006780 [Uroleucon formosanum]
MFFIGGTEIQMLKRANQDTENIELIIGSGGRRSKRSCCGGDGDFGSVKFSKSSDPREDVISPKKVETTNGSEQRPASYTIIGGDRSSGLDQFSNRTDVKMDKLYLFSKIPSINDILR